MDLFFIRHGQSLNNDLVQKTGGRIGRKSDPDLTELGHIQAARLSNYIQDKPKDFGFTHIYSSLMTRAIQTAIPLAEITGLPILGNPDLHESGGVYLEDEVSGALIGQAGKNRLELQALYHNLILPDTIDGTGWWNMDFETAEVRPLRARRVAEWLYKTHGNTSDRVVVVSHYGFFNHLIWAIIGLERPQGSWFVMNNTAISHFKITPEGIDTIYLNRVDHLLPEQISE